MDKIIPLITGLLLLSFLFLFLTTFTVNYDETVIVTTFGAATTQSIKNASGNNSGMFFKIPWPVQNITRFDRRIKILENRLEQQETKDKKVIVIKAFLIWKIRDPLQFYRMFGTVDCATSFLLERLRASKAEISNFTFDDLTNSDSSLLKIDEANDMLLKRIHKETDSISTGISIISVGINRLILPENITKSVFQRMKHSRQRQAQNTRSQGNAVAKSIISKTDSDKKRIVAFTEMMSQRIRAEGDSAAARYYKEYSKSANFAVFLKKLDAFKISLRENTTFILDTKSEPFDLLENVNK